MKCSKNIKNNRGMTIPEFVMASLMFLAFMGVFVVVAEFTAKFMRPLNLEGEKDFAKAEKNMKVDQKPDIMNDHLQIHIAIDSIISTLSQPGVDESFIRKLTCTNRPNSDWDIPDLGKNAIPDNYNLCITPTQLFESTYEELNNGPTVDIKPLPGIYIIYAKPNNGITYNSAPIRRIFCRPRPYC